MPHSSATSTSAASESGEPVSIASSTLPLAQIPSATPVPHLRRYADAVVSWFRGPDPPVDVAFRPLFPRIQTWPTRAFQCHLKRRRAQLAALVAFLLLWLLLFIVVVHYSRFADLVEGVVPMHLGCGASLWAKNNFCGLNGEGCLPFSNSSFAFRCPSDCVVGGRVLNPRAVGDQVVAYRTFVVGGGRAEDDGTYGTYRADSFICPSAVHAGVFASRFGGCGVLVRTGEASGFPATRRHGIESIGFDATFPSSYTFASGVRSTACKDLRWHLFGVSVPFTTAISVISPTPAIPFYATFVGVFFHVALASDPPYLSNPYALVSRALSRFLPAAFVAHFLWVYVLRRPHKKTPPIERTVLYLAGLWVGALTNITFDKIIPISRLTARDLGQQPGAKAALAVIVATLILIVVGQIYYLRLCGRLPKMAGLYATLGTSLGLLAAIPGTSLRIHHYILALLLLPGCSLPTRPSILYQGLLVGLFINGVARWGFASIIETPESLVGDGLYYSSIPTIDAPVVTAQNITFTLPMPPDKLRDGSAYGVTGVSVLVNDVERYQWRLNDAGDVEGGRTAAEWTYRRRTDERSYVRMAWLTRGGGTMDYTRAGVVERNDAWRPPPKGRS